MTHTKTFTEAQLQVLRGLTEGSAWVFRSPPKGSRRVTLEACFDAGWLEPWGCRPESRWHACRLTEQGRKALAEATR